MNIFYVKIKNFYVFTNIKLKNINFMQKIKFCENKLFFSYFGVKNPFSKKNFRSGQIFLTWPDLTLTLGRVRSGSGHSNLTRPLDQVRVRSGWKLSGQENTGFFMPSRNHRYFFGPFLGNTSTPCRIKPKFRKRKFFLNFFLNLEKVSFFSKFSYYNV